MAATAEADGLGGDGDGDGDEGGGPAADRPESAAAIMSRIAPAESDAVLLTASCAMWCGGATFAKGWLCATRGALTALGSTLALALTAAGDRAGLVCTVHELLPDG